VSIHTTGNLSLGGGVVSGHGASLRPTPAPCRSASGGAVEASGAVDLSVGNASRRRHDQAGTDVTFSTLKNLRRVDPPELRQGRIEAAER